MSAYDERLAVVDTGDTLVLSVPIPPPAGGTPPDLLPILDRLGDLEADVAAIKAVDVTQSQDIAVNQSAITDIQTQLTDILARLDALEATP